MVRLRLRSLSLRLLATHEMSTRMLQRRNKHSRKHNHNTPNRSDDANAAIQPQNQSIRHSSPASPEPKTTKPNNREPNGQKSQRYEYQSERGSILRLLGRPLALALLRLVLTHSALQTEC